eukprot:3613270-Heterocapsa_arctica.AAC.1
MVGGSFVLGHVRDGAAEASADDASSVPMSGKSRRLVQRNFDGFRRAHPGLQERVRLLLLHD